MTFRTSTTLSQSDLKHAHKIQRALPGWIPSHGLDITFDDDGEFPFLDCLLVSEHPYEDYAGTALLEEPHTIILHAGDSPPPCRADQVVISTQLTHRWKNAFSAGIPYPAIDVNAYTAMAAECHVQQASCRYGIAFNGWVNPSMHASERVHAIAMLREHTAELNANIMSYPGPWRGAMTRVDWLRWHDNAAICVVPPGHGPNSWRLSELLARGSFCIAISPVDELLLDPPLVPGRDYITCLLDDIVPTCRYWLARPPHERAAIAMSGAAWAARAAYFPGPWERNVRRIIDERCAMLHGVLHDSNAL